LPWAFAQGGTVLVTACLVSSYWFALKALEMLVKSQETLINAGKATQEEVQTYAGLTAKAIGPAGDVICRVLNVVTCFGITVGYMIFVADTCISMLPADQAATYTTAKMLTYNLPVWLFMAWQRSIAGVNLISLFGTTTVALSMVWVAISALRNPMQAIPLADISQFSGFFGDGRVSVLHPLHALLGAGGHAAETVLFCPPRTKRF
jgi:proton-coupled amino acid transporter